MSCPSLVRLSLPQYSTGIKLIGNPALKCVFCRDYPYWYNLEIPLVITYKKPQNYPRMINELPAMRRPYQPAEVVGSLSPAKTAVVNGVTLPLYSYDEVLFAKETDLAKAGYGFRWDGENRTSHMTEPEKADWRLTDAMPEGDDLNIISSDIIFELDGFYMPALNVGDGESVIEINAVSGQVLY